MGAMGAITNLRIVVMDSDVTIALLKSGAIFSLAAIRSSVFHITEVNFAEITIQRAELEKAISGGHLIMKELTDPDGLLLFGQLLTAIDGGEAATIALADVLGGDVAMHDRAGRRAASERLGKARVHRLEDVLVEAVKAGALSAKEADAAAERLRTAGDYHTPALAKGMTKVMSDPAYGFTRRTQ